MSDGDKVLAKLSEIKARCEAVAGLPWALMDDDTAICDGVGRFVAQHIPYRRNAQFLFHAYTDMPQLAAALEVALLALDNVCDAIDTDPVLAENMILDAKEDIRKLLLGGD